MTYVTFTYHSSGPINEASAQSTSRALEGAASAQKALFGRLTVPEWKVFVGDQVLMWFVVALVPEPSCWGLSTGRHRSQPCLKNEITSRLVYSGLQKTF